MLWLFILPASPNSLSDSISHFSFFPFCFHSMEAFEVSVQQVKLFRFTSQPDEAYV